MRYFIFAYNMPTICRAIQYINTEWGKANSTIIFANIVSKIPNQITKDYNVKLIEANSADTLMRGFRLIFNSCKIANLCWKVLDNEIEKNNDDVTLVVFRDNEVYEATLIDRAKSKYGKKINIWIIEEGAGIYSKIRTVPLRFFWIKKTIYKIMNVSTYSLNQMPQGLNPYVDKVICSNPEQFLKKMGKINEKRVEKIIPIFTYELNKYMIGAMLKCEECRSRFDYVFLTQPLSDFRTDYQQIEATYNKMLPIVLEHMTSKGNVIIKPHQRDNFDYSKYISDKVSIVEGDLKNLPFECMMQYYGFPQMISMFSSVSITIKCEKPSLYVYKLFELPITNNLYPKDFYEENNIIVCSSIEQLIESLI